MKKNLHILLGLVLLTSVAGCSLFGSGDKTGDGQGLSESDLNAQRDRYGDGGIPFAEGEGVFHDIHFAYDSSAVGDQSRQDIEYNAQILKDHSDVKVILEGHCDERGTNEYNMALGAARAKAVENVLVSYGLAANRLDTISYGEEVPLDPGHDESAWSQNRRVHFSASKAIPRG